MPRHQVTVSCFRKIQTGFTFLVPAHPGRPGKRAVNDYVFFQEASCFHPSTQWTRPAWRETTLERGELTAVVGPDVEQVLDELNLLVEVERKSSVLVEMRRRAEQERAEDDGQVR